MESVSYVVS